MNLNKIMLKRSEIHRNKKLHILLYNFCSIIDTFIALDILKEPNWLRQRAKIKLSSFNFFFQKVQLNVKKKLN